MLVEDMCAEFRHGFAYPLLATRHLRSQAPARTALITEEFELADQGEAYVEFDFAVATLDVLYVGEAKKRNALAANAKTTKRELNKLLDGSRQVGATHLVLATAAPAWKETMLTAVKEQVHGDLRASKDTPQILLLTALGATPALTTLNGTSFAVE